MDLSLWYVNNMSKIDRLRDPKIQSILYITLYPKTHKNILKHLCVGGEICVLRSVAGWARDFSMMLIFYLF
jgi:hypothetical protein